MARLEKLNNGVAVVWLTEAENRFNPKLVRELYQALDEAEGDSSITSLVLTNDETVTGGGRVFSNGLDLNYLTGATEQERATFLYEIQLMARRLLLLPFPTVAAINGHAFAGGAVLAFCMDYRVMRTGRGFLCFPEVSLGLPFPPPLATLLGVKMSPNNVRELMLLGRRISADNGVEMQVIDVAADAAAVLPKAIQLAKDAAPPGADRDAFREIKLAAYGVPAQAMLVRPTSDDPLLVGMRSRL